LKPIARLGCNLGPVVAAAGLATLGIAAFPAQAFAGNGLVVYVNSAAATQSPAGGGNCNWTVSSSVTITNTLSSPTDISNIFAFVNYGTVSDPNGVDTAITVSSADGFVDGATIPANSSTNYPSVVVTFTLPCSAQTGIINFDVATSNNQSDSGGDSFLSPAAGPIGGLLGLSGAAVLLGGGAFLVSRRRRRQADVVVS
jgi:hypothetical protein